MIRNMEAAAADDFAALLAAAHRAAHAPFPASCQAPARPERAVIIDQMTQVMVDLSFAGLPTTRDDLRQRGFSAGEIDELGEIATRHARLYLETIEMREKPRYRVPAGRAAQ